MTNLVKKHMIGLFALVLTVATMSFKMVEKSNMTLVWFAVGSGGSISGQIDPDEDCEGDGTLCAVAFNPGQVVDGQPPITNINQNVNHIQSEREKY